MAIPTLSIAEVADGDAQLDLMLDGFIADTAACSEAAAAAAAAAEAFGALADRCRDADERTRLTQRSPKLAQASSSMLRRALSTSDSNSDADSGSQLLEHVLRCMANQSADNPAARAQLLAAGGVEAIGAVLSSLPAAAASPGVARAAFGAALNVALDCGECARALLGAGALHAHLQALGGAAGGAPRDVWPIVCMGVDALCEHADFGGEGAEYAPAVLQTLARELLPLPKASADLAVRGAMRALVWVLCEAVEKSAAARAQLGTPAAVLALFDVLEFYAADGASSHNGEQREENEGGEHKEVRKADALTQAIAAVSGDDAALAALFASRALLQRLEGILMGSSAAMAAAAALCLGNLARSDAHCTQLVAEHAPMVRALIHAWLTPRSVNVRTRHAASGVLKNLSLAPANRAALADWGLVGAAAGGVASAVVPLQANCIGMLRHLAASSVAVQPMVDAGALRDALHAVQATDVAAVRCEGSRLIAAIARRAYLPGESPGARDAIDAAQYDLATPLVRLAMLDGARHPLLRQESLVALTVLATDARHRLAILRLLVPANSAKLAKEAKKEEAGEKEEEEEKKDEEEEKEEMGFAGVLADLITQGADGPLPQAALQATSLVTQLAAATSSSTSLEDEG
ncbi:Rap1 GTPase-GDP dissociation stimulator 1, partial [Coemansia sp. RSA 1836]